MPFSPDAASAASTSRPCSDSTPATRLNSPGRSGATRVSTVPSPRTTVSPAASSARCSGGRERRRPVGMTRRRRRAAPIVRSTSSATSSAFHVPHAAGPVAQRVGLGQRGEQLEGACGRRPRSATASIVAGSSRSRRVATSGSSRWWRTMRDEHVDVVGRRSPCAGPMRADQLDADLGVVAGPALADVVQQRADHEQVGPVDPVGQRRRVGRGLAQVPVDGEAVVGVALRPRRAPAPTRAGCAPTGRAGRAPRSRRWRGGPAEQQVDERVAGAGRPRIGQSAARSARRSSDARSIRVSRLAAAAAARRTSVGSSAGSASGREVDLAVAQHQPGAERRGRVRVNAQPGPASNDRTRCQVSSDAPRDRRGRRRRGRP